MNRLNIILITLAILFITVVFILQNAFKNNKFTCSKYILNTYLYILLSFIFIALLLQLLDYKKFNFRLNFIQFIGIFILTIGILILTMMTKPSNVILKHLLWMIFVLLIGIILYPLYIHKSKESVLTALISTIGITVILSIIAFVKPEWISLKLGPILFILLIAGIILELTSILLGGHRTPLIFKGFMYFFIVLFSLYILYDTKMLQIRAKNCIKADYVNESLHLFLDIVNIFARMLSLGR
jgi:FtsH-binding integral membrane protein